MTDAPKKKRKLYIVDIGPDGRPVDAQELPPFGRLPGIEQARENLLSYVKQLSDYYKVSVPIPETIHTEVDKVLDAKSPEEANALIQTASDTALRFFQNGGL